MYAVHYPCFRWTLLLFHIEYIPYNTNILNYFLSFNHTRRIKSYPHFFPKWRLTISPTKSFKAIPLHFYKCCIKQYSHHIVRVRYALRVGHAVMLGFVLDCMGCNVHIIMCSG